MAGLKCGVGLAAMLAVAVGAGVAQSSTTQKPADGAKDETRITKEQAKELFKSVDEILAFASKTPSFRLSIP